MNTVKATFSYMFKNFIKILPLVIIPAVLMAFFFDISKVFILFKDIALGNQYSLIQIYKSVSIVFSVNIIWGLVTLVILSIFTGVILGMIDRHFKIGTFSYKKIFTCLDETILLILPTMFICMGIYELLMFIASCIMFSFSTFIPSVALVYVFIAVYVVIMMLVLTLFMLILHLVPAKLGLGYRFADAFSVSIKGVKGHKFKLCLMFIIPIIIFWSIMVLSRFFFPSFIIGISIVSYILVLMYEFSLIMVSYSKLNDVERNDIKKKLFD